MTTGTPRNLELAATLGLSPGGVAASRAHPRDDLLAPVLELEDRVGRAGAAFAIAVAVLSHAALSYRAFTSLYEMRAATASMRESLHDYFWATYEVEVARPEPKKAEAPKAPEPEPEPEAPPPPKVVAPPAAKPPPKDDPYDPPAAPAQAAKVLTAAEKPDEPVDLTDRGFVSGEGTGPAYGRVAVEGTAQKPTFDTNAKLSGVPGGRGTGEPSAPPAPKGPDRSRPAGLSGGTSWGCPFPPEADVEQINDAVVDVLVTVRPDGSPQAVRVMSDPGHGFGRAARMCAMTRRYAAALDRDGNPIVGTTPPIKVRFTR